MTQQTSPNEHVSNANVDAQELNKFSELADEWWDTEGKFKSLHDINPLRVEYIEEKVGGLFNKRILDVGCGGGILSEALAHKGGVVHGIDMVDASLQIANLHRLESGVDVEYHLTTAEDWAEKHADKYDVVCCLEMLEHVPDPASVVEAVAKLVKPGGIAVFSTLNRNPKSWLFAIAMAEYVLGMVPRGTHDVKKFIKPSELYTMVESSGLSPEDMTGLHFNPLLQSYYLSDQNVDVNYFLVTTKPKK